LSQPDLSADQGRAETSVIGFYLPRAWILWREPLGLLEQKTAFCFCLPRAWAVHWLRFPTLILLVDQKGATLPKPTDFEQCESYILFWRNWLNCDRLKQLFGAGCGDEEIIAMIEIFLQPGGILDLAFYLSQICV